VRATNSCFTCWECNYCQQQLPDADPRPFGHLHPCALAEASGIGRDERTFEQPDGENSRVLSLLTMHLGPVFSCSAGQFGLIFRGA
jgi:hypothetical protein